MSLKRLLLLLVWSVSSTACSLWAADNVRLNEFMAANQDGLRDENGERSDWIELYNAGANVVNLDGWFLTDITNNYQRWRFPATNINPNSYLIVFASNKNRDTAGKELHTNFRLSNDGEYLGLVRPDLSIASAYDPKFPLQVDDVSFGIGGTAVQVTLLNTNVPAKAFVPLNGNLEVPGNPPTRLWTAVEFNDSGWQSGNTGIGYDTGVTADYRPYIGLNVAAMSNVNETVYVRIPFVVTDPTAFEALTLRIQYDDGFIAYLNGREIAWDNAPDPSLAVWNSGAPANRADPDGVLPRNFDVSSLLSFLQAGTNMLAIQGLNNLVGSSDLLINPQLIATARATGAESVRYFPVPTPGAANNAGVTVLGPILSDVEHIPNVPTDADSIAVRVRIREAFADLQSARLRYRIMYGAEVELPLLDNGQSGDAAAGDGIYGAVIPASVSTNGQMIRWYISTTDVSNKTSRFPPYEDPNNSPQYLGTVVHDPTLTNPLPVLHWFIQTPTAADTDAGTRCALFYLGEFYDNVNMNIHGQSSRSFPKHSYDVDFHPGFNFRWKEGEKRVDDINLLTTYPDKAHMRNILSYDVYKRAGVPYHFVEAVRVQQNGAFWGDMNLVENGDDNFLERLGMDVKGALYKMYNQFLATADTTTGAEKKTRKTELNTDLNALFNGLASGAALRNYVYDNINIPEVVNFLAARDITADVDCCHKNYYFYRDTEGTGEWQMLPWDVDLSFGRVWHSTLSYWDQVIYSNQTLAPQRVGGNRVPAAVFNTPEIRQMYLRRFRTLMDEMVQPPGTAPAAGLMEQQIDALVPMLAPDSALDLAKWGTWGNGAPNSPCCVQTLQQAVDEIKNVYLPSRRTYLFSRVNGGTAELPATPQPTNAMILFGAIDYNPSSANQEQEYIALRNTNNYAVDISGWQIQGGAQYTFQGGVVIPANGILHVAANVRSFRTRTTPPSANQGVFVQGNYNGRLSARGEALQIVANNGRLVVATNLPPTPSLVQSFLRISEIMYHPPGSSPGITNDEGEFEYIELVNTAPLQTLNLNGVHFTEGVVFNFTGSAITNLAPGNRVLVVHNLAAFTQRYGAGLPVAGVYTGNLDDSGEHIRLEDAANEKVLEFDFDDAWYPGTDGVGFSLVIRNAQAPFDTWGLKESWRPSGQELGTPGAGDSPLLEFHGILVNEVLTHTDPPLIDTIELYNPTTDEVNLGGWYISDDLLQPKKYRIAAGTTIGPGAYMTFNEMQFNANPANPTNFSFSSTGDEAYIFSGDGAGQLTGYLHGYGYGAAENGVSFGRYFNSQNTEFFVAQADRTLGMPNSGPKVGPVVITEVFYHPQDIQSGAEIIEDTINEYIEVRNITDSPVSLFDTNFPSNTWRIAGGVDFTFPTSAVLPAQGLAVIVTFHPVNDPTAAGRFRTRFGLSQSVALYGPFTGQLNNDGDDFRLEKPDNPISGGPNDGDVPYILVEDLDFTDSPPWPVAADGLGASLQRINSQAFANDPSNWTGPGPTPGVPYLGGALPVVTVQPLSQNVVAFSDVTLGVTVSGQSPFQYQWRFGDENIVGAMGPTLLLENITPSQGGAYSVVIFNGAGATLSSNATLTVLIPASILKHPVSVDANAGTNITLTVSASSTTPLTYQWRKNGIPINGATATNLNLVNVQATDDALYDVTVTDSVGTVFSLPARLTVLIAPTIVVFPLGSTNAIGSSYTLSVQVSNTATLPISYRWRRNTTTLTTQMLNSRTAFYTLTNLQASNIYSVIITNKASYRPGVFSPNVIVSVVAASVLDTDGDGIPDSYEMAHGLNKDNAADATQDADGDGISNRDEYISGTDPQSAASYLKIVRITHTDQVQIEFRAANNRTYSVLYRDNATSGPWTFLGGAPALSSTDETTRSVMIADPQPPQLAERFYRLVSPAQTP